MRRKTKGGGSGGAFHQPAIGLSTPFTGRGLSHQRRKCALSGEEGASSSLLMITSSYVPGTSCKYEVRMTSTKQYTRRQTWGYLRYTRTLSQHGQTSGCGSSFGGSSSHFYNITK